MLSIQPAWTWLAWDFSTGKQVGGVGKAGDFIPRAVHRYPPKAALSPDGKAIALGKATKIELHEIE